MNEYEYKPRGKPRKHAVPQITRIIQGAIERNGYSAREIADMIGLPYSTLIQQRFRDPGTWRFFEWGGLLRHIQFYPEELTMIEHLVKGGRTR